MSSPGIGVGVFQPSVTAPRNLYEWCDLFVEMEDDESKLNEARGQVLDKAEKRRKTAKADRKAAAEVPKLRGSRPAEPKYVLGNCPVVLMADAGESLDGVTLPMDEVVAMGMSLLETVTELHKRSVIHRHISPRNVAYQAGKGDCLAATCGRWPDWTGLGQKLLKGCIRREDSSPSLKNPSLGAHKQKAGEVPELLTYIVRALLEDLCQEIHS
ncbi:hypothetical protein SELMODRAFT_426699 [Selaginella moellendorffii]|uniref:Protein kinase domain-containing protein n=1 Tax=Selaginella moellendorffii TaxID=88036 RepID=D8SX79_SELML|nr:hypothetical protein SELMODRAFT_426699 [Selaginella moellendorffii]